MIELYKIGLSNLPDKDSNSAKFEYDLIKNTLKNLNLSDTLIILGGKFSKSDEIIYDKLNNYKFKVFIATDTLAIATCKSIINRCDLLLHQVPYGKIPDITIKQTYSYIPELFYKEEPYEKQDDLLMFGGSFRDVKEVVLDYTDKIPSKLVLKTEAEDGRLEYNEYIKELKKHKYGLVLLRNSNHIKGWITSRFVEYISCNVFPIVHYTYDENFYFESIVTKNGHEARLLIEILNTHEYLRQEYINQYKARFAKDKYKFVDTINNAWEEHNEQIKRT